jgi:hypothetical protein
MLINSGFTKASLSQGGVDSFEMFYYVPTARDWGFPAGCYRDLAPNGACWDSHLGVGDIL